MIKVLFVCYGNICRSPMAEFMLKQKVKERGLDDDFVIASKATSDEEIGHDIYPLAQECLKKHHISYTRHEAARVKTKDYFDYDYIFAMDHGNIAALKRVFAGDKENKIRLLNLKGEIADPWYTRDFEKTYHDIDKALDYFLENLQEF